MGRCSASLLGRASSGHRPLRRACRAIRPASSPWRWPCSLRSLIPAGAAGAPRDRARRPRRRRSLGGFAALALARGRDRLPGPAPLPRRPLPQRRRPEKIPGMNLDSRLPLGRGNRATPASASPGPPPAFSSTASTAPTSPTRSSTSAKRARTAPSTRSRPARAFRAAVNAADLDYLVTSPFLNFIHTGNPIPRPRPAGCAATQLPSRFAAPVSPQSGGSAASSTPQPAAPPTLRSTAFRIRLKASLSRPKRLALFRRFLAASAATSSPKKLSAGLLRLAFVYGRGEPAQSSESSDSDSGSGEPARRITI